MNQITKRAALFSSAAVDLAEPDEGHLHDTEQAVLLRTEAMLGRLEDAALDVTDLAVACRNGYSEQRRLARLSDRIQAELQHANARLGEQNLRIRSLNETLKAEIQHRQRLEGELRVLRQIDVPTGAMSRSHFFEVAEREMLRRRRSGETISLLLLDIDRFRNLNDLEGHNAGDAVLCALVENCQHHVRTRDMFARIGGASFALLLPAAHLHQALIVAERMRNAVAEMRVLGGAAAPMPVTVSIGAAEIGEGEIFQDLLRRADTALSRAKRAGCNMVAHAPG